MNSQLNQELDLRIKNAIGFIENILLKAEHHGGLSVKFLERILELLKDIEDYEKNNT